MPDNYLGLRENNRRIVRGGSFSDARGETAFQVGPDETAKAIIDLAGWLDGETISSVALENSGLSATSSNTTTRVTLTVSAVTGGYSEVSITTSGSRIRVERLAFSNPPRATVSNDYGWA